MAISEIIDRFRKKSRSNPADNPDIASPSCAANQAVVTGDNPIKCAKDDVLERNAMARSFAHHVLALDATEGLVVGVLGAWGSGKTSFVNLSRAEFEQAGVPVLDFNPWMFSGAEQLVLSFFVELSAQLKLRPNLGAVGKNLEEYGEIFAGMGWLPLVGPWIERGRGAVKIISKALQHRKDGVGERRTKLEKGLAALPTPILVILDDIDRLSTQEIRDIFKLVRLTASFPNIIYIVIFDRVRVEEALAEQGIPGRSYLEKILQVAVDLPAVPDHVIVKQIFASIESSLAGIKNPGQLNQQVWPDVFMEIIRPLIRNMRDIRRYAAAIRGTVEGLDGQIELADVLSLEAIRVFLPDVFSRFNGALEGLTSASPSYSRRDEGPHLKQQIDSLLEVAGPHDEVVRDMIRRLFPAAQRHIGGTIYGAEWKADWLKHRRVASEDILRLYLERVVGTGLRAFTDAEQAWQRIADADALNDYLRSIDPDRIEDVIGSLEVYEEEFSREHVVPGAVVLLNLLPDLPERPRTFFGFDTRLVASRVVYRLLKALREPNEVEAAVRQIIPRLGTLSSKLEVVGTVGYIEGLGHKLVSQEAAARFEREWRDDVKSVLASGKNFDISREHDILRVLGLAKHNSDPSEQALILPDTPELTLALLRSARSDQLRQYMGNRAVQRYPRLDWKALVCLFGDETILCERIGKLKDVNPKGDEELIDLAEKYLGGWRPEDFGDD